jgi:hypothetical protein
VNNEQQDSSRQQFNKENSSGQSNNHNAEETSNMPSEGDSNETNKVSDDDTEQKSPQQSESRNVEETSNMLDAGGGDGANDGGPGDAGQTRLYQSNSHSHIDEVAQTKVKPDGFGTSNASRTMGPPNLLREKRVHQNDSNGKVEDPIELTRSAGAQGRAAHNKKNFESGMGR